MKNLKYFPFERNRYFYGKLLTVSDFDAEQRYVNDKRRLQNRLLHGAGVVCGLSVVLVNDTTISLEPGFALDALGREIVADTPVIRKLSMIDGFAQAVTGGASTLYLTIEYDEQPREPVYSVAGSGGQGEEVNHNKIGEGYRLALTDQAPDLSVLSLQSLREKSSVLFSGSGVSITQTIPSFVRAGDDFEVLVQVDKGRQTQTLTFNYQLRLTCAATPEGGYTLPVVFDEAQHHTAARYTLRYRLRAAAVSEAEVSLQLPKGGLHVALGGRDIPAGKALDERIALCPVDRQIEMKAAYARIALDDMTSGPARQPVVLARIELVGVGEAYAIDRVDQLPFAQMIVAAPLRAVLSDMDRQELRFLRDRVERLQKAGGAPSTRAEAGRDLGDMRAGFITLEVPIGARPGQRIVSEEIIHGLGLGHVMVVMGLVGDAQDTPTVFGDPGVFQGAADALPPPAAAQVAAVTYPQKGTFRAGAVLGGNAGDVRQVTLRWWAYRHPSERGRDVEGASLVLRPDMAYLSVRESIVFEPVASGLPSADCTYQIKESEGGLIEPTGKYTAPGQPGVYEVVATSLSDPNVTASAFVVVRE